MTSATAIAGRAVAGWQTVTSTTYDGYTFPVSGVTGVRAQWTQPSATGQDGAFASIWIGIGGWSQLLPAGPHYPQVTVVPGVKVAVSIVQLRPPQEKWQISVDDMSADQTYTQVVQYDSPGTCPSLHRRGSA